jgi:hypothetical protein
LEPAKTKKICGFIASVAIKFEEMQPLSIKYSVLFHEAFEKTILSLGDH